METSQMLGQMLILMLLLIVGFIIAKLGIIGTDENKMLSNLVIKVFTPAMLIVSSMNIDSFISNSELFKILITAFIPYLVLGSIAFAVPYIIRSYPEDFGTMRFATIFGNATFMGFPVIKSLFGDEYGFLVTVLAIPFQILCYSIGIYMIKGNSGDGQLRGFSFRDFAKTLVSAPMLSSVISIIIFVIRVPVHPIIYTTGSLLANCTVPLAMIIIGVSLASIEIKTVFCDWRIYIFAAVRLILCPIVMYVVLRVFISDPIMLGIMTVLSAMPVATNSTMLAIQYGGNEVLASKAVFLTTIMSSVTIPFIVYILL